MQTRIAAAVVARLFAHRRAVVVAWIVVSVALAVAATRLGIDGRLDALVPAEDRAVAEHVEVLRRLGASEIVYVDVSAEDPAALARAADVTATRLQTSGLFRDVFGRADAETLARTAAFVGAAAPLFLETADYGEIEARLRADALAERVESQVARLLEPGGAAGETRFRSDPLEISSLALRRALGGGATATRPSDGMPVSADGKHALVAAATLAPMGDEAAGDAVESLVESIARDAGPAVKVSWIGGHRFYRANARSLQTDITLVSIVEMVLVVLVVAVGYPGLRSVSLAAVAGVMAMLTAAAVAALAFGAVSGIALAFGGALAGICVDCVLHLRATPFVGESREASVRRTFAAVAPSVVIGALTSVAAFLVLLASPVAVHRQIGVAGAAGIAGAALFAVCVGPILAAGFARDRNTPQSVPRRRVPFETISLWMWRRVLARPNAWLVATLLVVGASVAVLPRLGFQPDLRSFESKDAATLGAERSFERAWGGLLSRTLLVVRDDDVESALRRTEDLVRDFGPSGANGPAGVAAGAWTSAGGALPSLRTQDARWTAWTAFWNDARREALRRDLVAAAEPVGVVAGAFDPFLDGILRRPPAIDAATMRTTALRPLVDRHLLVDASGARSVVSVPSDSEVLTGPASRRAEIQARGAHVLSGRDLGDAVAEATRSQLATLALPAAVAVGLLLWAYYRDVRRAAAALFPLVAGALVAGAGLWLCGEHLSLMNLPVMVPMFGFAVDYGVFTLDAIDESRADPARAESILSERGAGVLGAALATASGGFAMLFAAHPAVRSIGIALVWSVLACVFVAWAALPGMARWWGPRK